MPLRQPTSAGAEHKQFGRRRGTGRSDRLKAIQLLAVYVILGQAFVFVTPERPTR